jgi:hypothetical protein
MEFTALFLGLAVVLLVASLGPRGLALSLHVLEALSMTGRGELKLICCNAISTRK